jgi:radical SAM protein with 4Fe4S-binding SPASM domain
MVTPMKAALKPRINLEGRTALETVIPLSTPMVLFVDPSSACNFQCTFCPTGDRKLIAETGRYQGAMSLDLFKKLIDDLQEFDQPLKVLRLYKDGEPFVNRKLADMIAYAKRSDRVPYIDTTTNGSLLDPERMKPVLDAGLDKINISVDGMSRQTYLDFTKFDFDLERFVKNVEWLYANRGQCEVVIKVPNELVTEEEKQRFLKIFGELADRIFVENFAPCWPDFDIEKRTGVTITKGIYEQPIGTTDTCPYIFYGMSVNADGLVSACFLDWARLLLVGDARKRSLKSIWNSQEFNDFRVLHLEGRRRENPTCNKCGQLTHCLPDNIDPYRDELLVKQRAHMRTLGQLPASGDSSTAREAVR